MGCDVTGGKRFCGASIFGDGGFVRGGSATAQTLTRGGSTATILPISRTLKLGRFGDGAARPPSICGAVDRTAGGGREGTAGLVRGICEVYSFFNICAGGLKT